MTNKRFEPIDESYTSRIYARIEQAKPEDKAFAWQWQSAAVPIRRHLQWLHEGLDGWSVAMVLNDQPTKGSGVENILWARADDPAALDKQAISLATANMRGFSTHVCVGLRKELLDRYHRGKFDDVKCLPALWAEIDGGDPYEVWRELSLPDPSLVLQTSKRHGGGGYQLYWFLDEPTTQLETAQRVMMGIALLLSPPDDDGTALYDVPYKAYLRAEESITSAERNLRLMGTINHKPTRNKERVEMFFDPILNRNHYTLEDFIHLDVGDDTISFSSNDQRRWNEIMVENPDFVSAADIAQMLDRGGRNRARQHAKYWMAGCPVHGHADNLQIWTSDNGDTCLKCYAGCDWKDVVAALGLRADQLFRKKKFKPEENRAEAAKANRLRRKKQGA